jgi:enoyl-CoA hydratase
VQPVDDATLTVDYLNDNRIVVATIDRQHRRNAVDLDTLSALRTVLDDAISNESLRVVVIRGAGGHFSAGADLSGVESSEFRLVLAAVVTSLASIPIVTLAQIDGVCLGAGLQLAAACDLRVAGPDAVFGIPAAKLGVAVDEATVERLVELVGGGLARSILLAAELVSMPDAKDAGLVHRVGTYDDALAWALTIADLAPLSHAAHKAAFGNRPERGPRSAEVWDAIDRAWSSADSVEGREAFAQRRQPVFRGI